MAGAAPQAQLTPGATPLWCTRWGWQWAWTLAGESCDRRGEDKRRVGRGSTTGTHASTRCLTKRRPRAPKAAAPSPLRRRRTAVLADAALTCPRSD